MIWLTLRQQRLELVTGGVMLVLLSVFLLVTGLDMQTTYRNLGVAVCLTSRAPACSDIIEAFRGQYAALNSIVVWFALLPLVYGVLLAAPFVLELEQGTYRLAWTQSMTRTRWVTLKLGLLMTTAVLISLAQVALVTWWRTPLDHLDGSFQPRVFDVEGTVPLAYTVFAAALVLGVGTVLRRTVPAVAISLVGFLILRLGLEGHYRPSYMRPVVTTTGTQRSDWVLDQSLQDAAGHKVNFIDVLRACGTAHGQGVAIKGSCLQQHGITGVTTYQPGSRYWAFQAMETAIFLGLAAVLLALTVWWVRERVA